MPRIGDAVNGEDSSSDGTEKLPVTGSKWMYVSTIAAYIRTLTQTLTGKTIDLTDNTVTGTTAQFNTALSDGSFTTLAGSETLTNKTLTAPTIADFTNAAHDHGDADDGGSALASPTITTPTISGAITFPDNVTQTFNPGADNAGLNVGSIAGDPATPDNGDVWYDSAAEELTARINGANVALGAGGGGSVATDAIWDAKGDLAGGTGANTAARLAVGTNGQVLTADSGETTGMKWATASGGSPWTQTVSEDGTTFTNWTATAGGTWLSDGTVIKQTDTGATRRRAKYNTDIACALVLVRADIQLKTSGGDNRGGLLMGFDGGNGGSGCAVFISENDTVHVEVDGVANKYSHSVTINVDTWYTLQCLYSGHSVSVWLDGTLLFTAGGQVQALNTADFIGLLTYSAEAWFRNIKAWNLTLPA